MKTIHFIRHAKSSWEDSRLSDLRRPLSPRGQGDCRLMAPVIWELGWRGQEVHCSPATRAQQTISRLVDALPGRALDWHTDQALYTFSGSTIMRWLTALSDDLYEVTLVGHNPAFTEVIDQLAITHFNHLPTCGYVRLDTTVSSWSALRAGCAELSHFLKPKMLK
jgi:phosphohistidine phosphatase